MVDMVPSDCLLQEIFNPRQISNSSNKNPQISDIESGKIRGEMMMAVGGNTLNAYL